MSPAVTYVDPVPEQQRNRDMPGILLNTLPKSASIYIWEAIAVGLGMPKMRISGGWFPGDLVVPELVYSLGRGGVVTQEHLDASWRNKVVLSRHLGKMIVHVRDPRSSALEWAYHQLTMKADGLLSALERSPRRYCPDGFFSMSLTDQIGVQIGAYLPDAVKWVEDWLDAAGDPYFKTEVLIVQYEKFVEDEVAYFDRILDFYGIDKSLWAHKPFTPEHADDPLHEGQWHFRNARTDEWRDAFTPEQLDEAGAMMPHRLLKRFGWPER